MVVPGEEEMLDFLVHVGVVGIGLREQLPQFILVLVSQHAIISEL
jgi:hypothetical protein